MGEILKGALGFMASSKGLLAGAFAAGFFSGGYIEDLRERAARLEVVQELEDEREKDVEALLLADAATADLADTARRSAERLNDQTEAAASSAAGIIERFENDPDNSCLVTDDRAELLRELHVRLFGE